MGVRLLRAVLLFIGLALTLGPPMVLAVIAVLASMAEPAAQAGWVVPIGAAVAVTITVPQVGVMVLLAYLFLRIWK